MFVQQLKRYSRTKRQMDRQTDTHTDMTTTIQALVKTWTGPDWTGVLIYERKQSHHHIGVVTRF